MSSCVRPILQMVRPIRDFTYRSWFAGLHEVTGVLVWKSDARSSFDYYLVDCVFMCGSYKSLCLTSLVWFPTIHVLIYNDILSSVLSLHTWKLSFSRIFEKVHCMSYWPWRWLAGPLSFLLDTDWLSPPVHAVHGVFLGHVAICQLVMQWGWHLS